MDSMANTLNAIRQQANQSTQPINNKVLADCLFRDLRLQGLKDKDIVSLSSELIAQLTNDIKVRAEKLHAAEQPSQTSEKLTRTR
jgi:outer membrane murein-binding lipoprotein Lpp